MYLRISTAVFNKWYMKSKKSSEQPDLSLSDDDEGARFAWAGFGFRARGFGAAFSADGEKISTEHIFITKMTKNGFK